MTTVQETSNGHRVSPPPGHDATGVVSSDFSSGMTANKLHRQGRVAEPLSPRCQFTFSDGRRCTMARSDIHPSMCPFHAEREEQLFGSPAPGGGSVVGAAFDLAELYSACRDLTTAAGVNRALAQVFRLLAQRRISRQEAATFGHLAQLLLRTITLARAESADPMRIGVPGEQREPRHGFRAPDVFAEDLPAPSPADERITPAGPSLESADQEAERERRVPPQPASALDISPASSPAVPSWRDKNCTSAPQQVPINPGSSTASAPRSEPSATPAADNASFGKNASAHRVCNSSEINRSEIVELKVVQNEHLQEERRRAL